MQTGLIEHLAPHARFLAVLALLAEACAAPDGLRLDQVEPSMISYSPAPAPVALHGVFEPSVGVDLGASGSTVVPVSEAFQVTFSSGSDGGTPASLSSPSVRFVRDTLLEATPPPLLPPGTYDVAVVGPDGRRSSRASAFTVVAEKAALLDLALESGPVVAGVPRQLTITVHDSTGAIATSYAAAVSLQATPASALQPLTVPFAASDQGRRTVPIALTTAGHVTLQAGDPGGLTGSIGVDVLAAGLAHLILSPVRAPHVAGVPFPLPLPA